MPRELIDTGTDKRYVRRDGRVIWGRLSASVVRDEAGRPRWTVSQIQDISERKQLEERLVFIAGHDEMTGLLNRRRFREELTRGVSYAKRYKHQAALLLLDLDNFKQVNDTLGHFAGDQLVALVANRLRERLRATDTLARVGGDEFAVFLPEASAAQAMQVAAELVAYMSNESLSVEGHELVSPVSIGVAILQAEFDVDPEGLLMHADLAMYRAKQQGGGRYAVTEARGRPDPDIDPAPTVYEPGS